MTFAELAGVIDDILRDSLDAAYWAAVAGTNQNAAINMAAKDILARLPGVRLDDVPSSADGPVVNAIAEQAVYLLRTHDEQAEGKVVTGEGVQGLSMSYTLIGDAANVGLAPRAVTYLQQAKRQAMGKLRFSRG